MYQGPKDDFFPAAGRAFTGVFLTVISAAGLLGLGFLAGLPFSWSGAVLGLGALSAGALALYGLLWLVRRLRGVAGRPVLGPQAVGGLLFFVTLAAWAFGASYWFGSASVAFAAGAVVVGLAALIVPLRYALSAVRDQGDGGAAVAGEAVAKVIGEGIGAIG